MSEPDTFDKLIHDLRVEDRTIEEDVFNEYADRLKALVTELEPVLLPTFGSVGVEPGGGEDSDPPIYREVMGESAPGSDWVLVDPVRKLPVTDEPDAP